MTTPEPPLPRGGMSREAIALAEIGVTHVTPWTARAMVIVFLLAAGVVPRGEWRDGWLFYRPDVEYLTGRPFLEPAQIQRRIRAAPEWTVPPVSDPRPALIQ